MYQQHDWGKSPSVMHTRIRIRAHTYTQAYMYAVYSVAKPVVTPLEHHTMSRCSFIGVDQSKTTIIIMIIIFRKF